MILNLPTVEGRGGTRLDLSHTAKHRAMVRIMQLLPIFDRVQISAMLKYSFGSMSRIFSEMHNVGVLDKVEGDAYYNLRVLRMNDDLKHHEFNYTGRHTAKPPSTAKSIRYVKGAAWNAFIREWNLILQTPEVKPDPKDESR